MANPKRRKKLSALEESIGNADTREFIYKKIDKSLTVSFLGGAMIGASLLLYDNGYNLLAFCAMGASLGLFFFSRFNGLRFLFEGDE